MIIDLVRDTLTGKATFGKLFVDGKYLGETLEDVDRFLEIEGEGAKVDGQTAIPRGRYRLSVTFSQRFQKPMPCLHDVPYFDGVRIHGGNTEADTHGCPLLGNVRTAAGVANCAGINDRLINLVAAAISCGDDVWLTVK